MSKDVVAFCMQISINVKARTERAKEDKESQESQESHEKKRHSDIATRKNYCSTKAIYINKNSSSVKGGK